MITAAHLAQALNNPGGTMSATNTSSKSISSSTGFNGIAFDGGNSVWVSSSTQILNFDASTWDQKGTAKNITATNSDLASCSSPATLTIQKNVVGRASTSDQFTLSVTNSGTSIQPATTSGGDTGIQNNQIGPTPVMANTTYNFTETMAYGSASTLDAYTTTWKCTAPSPYTVNVSGTGTSGSVLVPATIDATGAAVTCAFTNTPKPGNVQWAKQDSATADMLSGSEWKITGPSPSTQNLAVTDCVGSSAAACTGTNDVNFQAGKFEVDGLAPGSYTLTETKPPTGYSLDSTPRPFTVVAGATVDLKDIQNTKLPVATVTVSKIVQDSSGGNSQLSTGWEMSTVLTTDPPSGQNPIGVAITPSGTQKTAGANGATTPWTVTYPSASTQASVTVEETQQTGYQFVSGTCKVTPATGSVRTVNLAGETGNVVSGINPGDAVACNFVNRQKPGSVSWSKTDESGHLLSGSEWTLTGAGVPSNTVVSDCATSSCAAGIYKDQDPAAGKFKLTGLAWATDYKLVESKAPAGYVLPDATKSENQHSFTISSDKLDYVFKDAFVNRQATPPTLPLTGGMGADAFVFGGSALMAVSAGVWLVLKRRSLVNI